MNNRINLAKSILVALCIFFRISAFAAEPHADEHLQAVKRMLAVMQVGELFMEGAKKKITENIKANPDFSNDYQWILAQLTPAEAIDRIAPVYADYLTTAQAEELSALFASPGVKKIWSLMMGRIIAGKSTLPPTLTWEERQAVDALAVSTAWRTLSNSIGTINKRLEGVSVRWGEQLMQQRYAGMAKDLADTLEGNAARKGIDATGTSQQANPSSRDQGLVQAYFALVKDFSTRNSNVNRQLAEKVKEIDFGTVLRPVNLISREGIEDGRRKLERFETEFSKSQREINRINDEFTASLHALPGTNRERELLIQQAEKGLAAAYERSIRMEENQRRTLAIMRRILTLADERFGQIHLQDNRLIFDDFNDLRLYESLTQQLASEVRKETELVQEQASVRDDVLKRLREGGTSSDAAATQAKESPLQQLGNATPTKKQLADEIERYIDKNTKPSIESVAGNKGAAR